MFICSIASNMLRVFRQLFSYQIDLPFDSTLIELDSAKSLQLQLEETFLEIKKLYHIDEELIQYLNKAYDGCNFLLEIAPLYDYQNHQANGYWTFVKVIIKFGKTILITTKNNNFQRDHIINVFDVTYFILFNYSDKNYKLFFCSDIEHWFIDLL